LVRYYISKNNITKAWNLYKTVTLYFAKNDKLVIEKLRQLYNRLEQKPQYIRQYLQLVVEDIGHMLVIQRPYYGLKAEELMQLAQQLGVSEKEFMVIDGIRTKEPVTFGPQYWLKLEHTRDSKITGSTIGPYNVYGETRKGQRIGEMETWNMYVQNMDLVHEELFTIRADHFPAKLQWLGNILVDDKEIVDYLVQVNTTVEGTDDILERFARSLGIDISRIT